MSDLSKEIPLFSSISPGFSLEAGMTQHKSMPAIPLSRTPYFNAVNQQGVRLLDRTANWV
jgi:hypothetical protein